MDDRVFIKVWHGGRINWRNKVRYVGGENSAFAVEVDKMSYFELTGYVMDFKTYKNQDFRMHYLVPGKSMDDGLVLIENDKDVMEMMQVLGDEGVRHWLHLYCISNSKRQGRVGVTCTGECPFKVYASSFERQGSYLVKSVVNTHTCQRNMTRNRQLTSSWVADQMLDMFKTRPHWPAKDIQDTIKEKYKVLVSKWFAYNTKRCAQTKLHGSMKERYGKVGSYLAALKAANPTSTFELVKVPPQAFEGYTSENEVFFRLFVCFDGVKKGFLAGCRRLLCLDGCFLKTFLGGMLLAAIGRDANDQMFPVAWAVVEGENTESWNWFMAELKKCLEVADYGSGWTLVSDQQKGLLNAVVAHWSKAEHRNCARHIFGTRNIKEVNCRRFSGRQ